jgi:hypothetical protein
MMPVSSAALESAAPAGSLVVHRGPPRPAPGTLTTLFFDAIATFSKPAALRYKADGAWQDISHAALLERKGLYERLWRLQVGDAPLLSEDVKATPAIALAGPNARA